MSADRHASRRRVGEHRAVIAVAEAGPDLLFSDAEAAVEVQAAAATGGRVRLC